MAKRIELIEQLVQATNLTIKEAIEVIDILIKNKFINIDTVKEIDSKWEDYGSVWEDKEILAYVNEGKKDNLATMENILSWGIFHQLTTGKIIGWNY